MTRLNAPLSPTLSLAPARRRVGHGKASSLDVVVRLAAPARPTAAARPTLNLALALDASGSMAGKAWEQAKAAALSLVRRLAPTDRVAVVVYDSHARLVLPSMDAARAQEELPALLAGQLAHGGTALHAGWLTAAQALAPFVSAYGISRVVLLSDGDANVGVVDPEALAGQAQTLAEQGITTSTYGLGLHFKEVVMTAMAVGGRAFYAVDSEQLESYFDAEFVLLSQTVGRQVRLKVVAESPDGACVTVPLNGYALDADGWQQLPALVSGAEAWAALEIALPAMAVGHRTTVRAWAEWVDPQTQSVGRSEAEATVDAGRRAGPIDEATQSRANEARAAKLVAQAAEEARRGDRMAVTRSLDAMRGLAGNNAYLNHVGDRLQTMNASGNLQALSKEAQYGASAMSTRVAAVHEDATVWTEDAFGLRKFDQGKANALPPEAP